MSVSGLTFNSQKISCYAARARGSNFSARSPSLISNGFIKPKSIFLSHADRKYLAVTVRRGSAGRPVRIKSGVYAAFGDMAADDSTGVFPRIDVKDPYKRLGISREASEEEIQAARNFLINKYGGHKPSVDAIESAHDKIIMQSFYNRKNPKIDVKKKVREVSQSRIVRAVTSRFETPATNVIVKTAIAFIVLGVLTVLFPTEEGPTLQVAISLIASVYFIHSRLRNKIRASLYGIAAFFGSWLLGTLLMVSVVPPILKGPRSLEVTTSLLSYVLLWVASTYLK
ncbi:protein CHAPERONE-LIKE PROTEIN OF POR1, chloroplastic [Asparagus officinalis]|uniref:protein CHAPERONE-LIKE PROTEIN OF POR1, chloroplastic n=1 Tax=Asparagus officinalis TaxID=4686 RepID=UPI00098E4711|nr:protein CHAPERONE-LIKE PROTEIN OF POR1, chloroplastic [Asparagus officinalis]